MAPLNAGPAAEVTRVRPSDALLWILDAEDLALEVASEAASEAFSVVEALRRHVCREIEKGFERRNTAREAVVADILECRLPATGGSRCEGVKAVLSVIA